VTMAETQEQTGKDWKSISLARQSEINSAIPQAHRLPPAVIDGLQDPRNLISIPEICGILSQRELEITSTPCATKLLADIRNRVYSAVEVTIAFCKRASIAHQLVSDNPCPLFLLTVLTKADQLPHGDSVRHCIGSGPGVR